MEKTVLPQELEIWYLIPAIRKSLAKDLIKEGLSQREAAKKLGVTEAAISQYLKGKRAENIRFGEKIELEIKNSAEKILKGGSSVREIQLICRECRKSMVLCRIHKKHGHVSAECNVCLRL